MPRRKIVGIITARGGSKRIPKKNIVEEFLFVVTVDCFAVIEVYTIGSSYVIFKH